MLSTGDGLGVQVQKIRGLVVKKSSVEGIADVGGCIPSSGFSVLVMRGLSNRALTSIVVKGGTNTGISRVSFLLCEGAIASASVARARATSRLAFTCSWSSIAARSK